MSTTILPALSGPLPERATAAADARPQSSASDAWRAAFEQAGGERFGGWFQAPADQPAAGASPGAAPLPAARAASAAFDARGRGPEAPRAGDGSAGDARASPTTSSTTRREAASDSAPAQGNARAQPTAQTAAAASTSDPLAAGGAPADAPTVAAAAQLPALLQSLLCTAVTLVAGSADAAVPEAAPPLAAGMVAASGPSEPCEDAAPVDDAAPAEEAAPERGTGATQEHDALRMHAEWTDAGVRIWLGADAQSLPDVAALTSQLQHWLASQGTSLLGLVCNGRDLLGSATRREGDAAAAPRAVRRDAGASLPFDFSNLYPSETR